ncbi:MAG TPA: glycosyltransferase family 4 protein [Dehalococcoidia bacterium]|nr:glycosyltransferase family 4 protein [Dehalococcoidia bacterium]
MGSRSLLLVSASLDAAARNAVAEGRWPRKDFFALADALGADVIDYTAIDASRTLRLIRRLAGAPVAQAFAAWQRRGAYDCIFSDGEHIGIPLAVLLARSHRRPRHVALAHLLTTRAKRAAFRWLRPQRGIDVLLTHASLQHTLAGRQLGLRPSQLLLTPYQVDPRFWAPAAGQTELLIASAGLEYRDYSVLIDAVRGLPIEAVIAAGSRWSTHRHAARTAELPANVHVTTLDYRELRDLYARARFVVVPLHEVENQAGVTTILEAMAMGRAVIVTATRGQRDVVRGRLCSRDGVGAEAIGGPGSFGLQGELAAAETGLYVPAADSEALRVAIRHLLSHPEEAERMGSAGRRLVEATFSLDAFVNRVAAVLSARQGLETRQPAARTPAAPATPRGE